MPITFSEFEAPIFKRLPKNDTGQAVGHQAGFVVPRALGEYFPDLPEATPLAPAPSTAIRAILVSDGISRGTVDTIYQHQTWGGTRSPERRVTANLRPLLASARKGDILLIERNLEDDFLYRFTLVRGGTAEFQKVDELTGGKDWGVLQGSNPPATNGQIKLQEMALDMLADQPFQPFEADAPTQTVKRVARSRAFRSLVRSAYQDRCAMCGGGLVNALGKSEVEAAHIIGRGSRGADDVRNGLALCRAHHWAFDQGMICVDPDRKILVKPSCLIVVSNAPLHLINGQPLSSPTEGRFSADDGALGWHRKRVFYGEI